MELYRQTCVIICYKNLICHRDRKNNNNNYVWRYLFVHFYVIYNYFDHYFRLKLILMSWYNFILSKYVILKMFNTKLLNEIYSSYGCTSLYSNWITYNDYKTIIFCNSYFMYLSVLGRRRKKNLWINQHRLKHFKIEKYYHVTRPSSKFNNINDLPKS